MIRDKDEIIDKLLKYGFLGPGMRISDYGVSGDEYKDYPDVEFDGSLIRNAAIHCKNDEQTKTFFKWLSKNNIIPYPCYKGAKYLKDHNSGRDDNCYRLIEMEGGFFSVGNAIASLYEEWGFSVLSYEDCITDKKRPIKNESPIFKTLYFELKIENALNLLSDIIEEIKDKNIDVNKVRVNVTNKYELNITIDDD